MAIFDEIPGNSRSMTRSSDVEVKSEKDYSTSSLDKFRAKFAVNVGESIILHPGDLSASSGILRLPLYMTPWIDWR